VNAPLGHVIGQVEASTGDRNVPIDYSILAGKNLRFDDYILTSERMF